jgi:signal transduction histidine kinase/ActR/RegA family two-component response regulator
MNISQPEKYTFKTVFTPREVQFNGRPSMKAEKVNPLRSFHNIVSNQSLTFDQKVDELLRFGLALFGLEVGIVSQIKGSDYKVLRTINNIDGLEAGMHFDLGLTYCHHTVSVNEVVGFHHVGFSQIASHPCYDAQKLEAYLAAPVIINNTIFGTINFSSPKPVSPFVPEDYEFIELFAQWLGSEIARKEVLEELKAKAITLAKLEKVGKVGSWSIDIESIPSRGKYVQWSEQTRQIHEAPNKYEPTFEEALSFYMPGENRDELIKAVDLAVKQGKPWDLKAQITTMKGRRRWVVTKGEAEFFGNKCIKLFGTFQDVTDSEEASKKLQEAKYKAEQATKSKSDFLANMSHEIRTPMNGVLGTLQLLERSNVDAESKLLISKANYSATSLLTIINDILDYSKIEANQLILEQQPFSMREVMEYVHSELSSQATEKHIYLKANLSKDFIDGWKGDVVRVRQILLNLCANAVKFTKFGGVSIELANDNSYSPSALSLSVKDTGIGMSEEAQARIFERFTQADSSTTRKFGGTGLGMSITVSLVQMMGGKLDVDSIPNQGTTITVTLPLERENIENKGSSPQIDCAPNLTGKTILIAEDNDINTLVIESMLKPTHADLHFAKNGLEAVAQFSNQAPDLVLMDIQMPEMDGLQAFAEIRKLNRDVPIVALTANVMSTDIEQYSRVGFTDHLAKPVDMAVLYELLRNALTSVKFLSH